MGIDEEYPFDKNIHILTYQPTDEQSLKILELRKQLENNCDIYNKYFDIKEWCDDYCLLRFLIARSYDINKSYEMINGAIKWRIERKPHHIEVVKDSFWKERMHHENKTGKIYIPGHDKWGRPIVIFDNSVQNTVDSEGQLYFLAWNLETAIKFMPKHTDKYVVFMHLENFSLFNCPNMKTTREVIIIIIIITITITIVIIVITIITIITIIIENVIIISIHIIFIIISILFIIIIIFIIDYIYVVSIFS